MCSHRICHLQIGTCHLPLQGLNYEPLQLLTFNTLQKEFRVEIRNEAFCALEKKKWQKKPSDSY